MSGTRSHYVKQNKPGTGRQFSCILSYLQKLESFVNMNKGVITREFEGWRKIG